ncbi:MAG: FeoB-associated Cys-rich membrane protein [Treponema sp.]|uniref:FeoB-associated Cys-rich membrane protein n=1 Tax=Treponema sp. TaxID=166 RepID=UPI001D942F9C|nr:FeoB-associated Cys-rich membrane protein [Treponema sp.]MBS7311628.1 FeoB-associated Cys-rich membrane protein [Treponema sp.]MCI5696116.1 FeoB-associated Cys-rich membrane protein [Spirochaetia bacterium]
MGTAIVCVILFIMIALIVKSLCKKYHKAKKSGGCCCGCSGCSSSTCKKNKS